MPPKESNIFINFFFIYTKMIMKKDYKKKACERDQYLSKEGQEKNWQYAHERHKNLSEDEKQKPSRYRKKYYQMRKNALL